MQQCLLDFIRCISNSFGQFIVLYQQNEVQVLVYIVKGLQFTYGLPLLRSAVVPFGSFLIFRYFIHSLNTRLMYNYSYFATFHPCSKGILLWRYCTYFHTIDSHLNQRLFVFQYFIIIHTRLPFIYKNKSTNTLCTVYQQFIWIPL